MRVGDAVGDVDVVEAEGWWHWEGLRGIVRRGQAGGGRDAIVVREVSATTQ